MKSRNLTAAVSLMMSFATIIPAAVLVLKAGYIPAAPTSCLSMEYYAVCQPAMRPVLPKQSPAQRNAAATTKQDSKVVSTTGEPARPGPVRRSAAAP